MACSIVMSPCLASMNGTTFARVKSLLVASADVNLLKNSGACVTPPIFLITSAAFRKFPSGVRPAINCKASSALSDLSSCFNFLAVADSKIFIIRSSKFFPTLSKCFCKPTSRPLAAPPNNPVIKGLAI